MDVYEVNFNAFDTYAGICNTSKYIKAEKRAEAYEIARRYLGLEKNEIIFCRKIITIN